MHISEQQDIHLVYKMSISIGCKVIQLKITGETVAAEKKSITMKRDVQSHDHQNQMLLNLNNH
jgi:hypothetical protein